MKQGQLKRQVRAQKTTLSIDLKKRHQIKLNSNYSMENKPDVSGSNLTPWDYIYILH